MRIFFTTLAAVCLSLPALADSIRVTAGAVADQVFQRDQHNRADIQLRGSATAKGTIEGRVTRQALPVPGFDWQALGRVESRQWEATLKGVPCGGPYRIELRLAGSDAFAAIENILVGDLWILAGQSNMEGVGNLVNVTPPHAQVHSFNLTDHWLVAEEPLHEMLSSLDAIHWKRRKRTEPLSGDALVKYNATRKKGAGLGLPFAVSMVERTGVPIGLVPCADGGTSMDEWSPTLKDRGGESLYGGTLRRFRAVGGKVAGILWYQGESDASAKAAPPYKQKFKELIEAFRADFGQPDLPFYYVQIGRFIVLDNPEPWHKVQDDERTLEAELPHVGMVSSIDSELDDVIHASTASQQRIGARLANLACHDLFPEVQSCAALKSGPRPVSAAMEGDIVRVRFSGVNGRLKAEGRIAGFTIHDASGAIVGRTYRATIDPADGSTILLYGWGKPTPGLTLHYGFGKDPYCNLKDEADMAVPVFGPIPIQQ